jgi:hypothetical protein
MIIAGMDISLTSSGIVRAELDDNLEVKTLSWFGFTNVAKVYKACEDNLFFYKDFPNYIERTIWMRNIILKELFPVEYVAVEDYSFASSGLTFNIGGFSEILKTAIYEASSYLRWYDIALIKKFATEKGNSDKLRMYDEYMKIPLNQKIDISKLPPVESGKGKSPTSDIIDAYYIVKMLQMELQLRRGIKVMRDLTEDQIWVFNRVTQTSKENIITREFLHKA